MGTTKRRSGPAWEPYSGRLRRELTELAASLDQLLGLSSIRNIDPNRGQSDILFLGAAVWGWAPSDDAQTRLRLDTLEAFRSWRDRFELLFRDLRGNFGRQP